MDISMQRRPHTTDSYYHDYFEDIFELDEIQPQRRAASKYGEAESMTFWSRYDPIRQPKGNTDHWSKFRQRTEVPMGPNVRAQDFINGFGGTGDMSRSRNSVNKSLLRNTFNERAKEGFKYWLIERPKPTSFIDLEHYEEAALRMLQHIFRMPDLDCYKQSFGKYGMGSYKTVLGIGNAPRT